MMKLEANEVAILLSMMNQAQINGKDAIMFGKILEKLQKEMDKLYGDWLPKGERPMTVKSTPSAAQIKKASKDYY